MSRVPLTMTMMAGLFSMVAGAQAWGQTQYYQPDRPYDPRYQNDRPYPDQRDIERRRETERREQQEINRNAPIQQRYDQTIVQLQQQHNQGVVQLQQEFNQHRISREQMDAGIAQLGGQYEAQVAQQQRGLPR